FFQQNLHVACCSVSKVSGEKQVIATLFEGTLGDIEESCLVTHSALLETLSDVGGNGNCRAVHFGRHSVDIDFGKSCSEFVERQNKLMGFLPYYQILKSFCWLCHIAEIGLTAGQVNTSR